MIFIVVAAAFVTAREDVPRVDAERDHLSPAALTVDAGAAPALKEKTTPAAKAPALATADAPVAAIERAVDEPQAEREPEQEPDRTTPVTITGCLERDEGAFRLTDASGANAPTARSWKSGFLRKRPAHIDLADAVGTLGLRNHIGRRVAATGTLIDRELRAHSVRPVGSCD
jgi:hypothetical protein